MHELKVAIELCRPTAIKPRYMHIGDAGMDLYAADDVILKPGESKVVPLGFKMALPIGYEMQIRARSGLSLKTRLRLPNGLGTIDAGYRGEVGVIMYNASPDNSTGESEILTLAEQNNRAGTYLIHRGERIAQAVIAPIIHVEWEDAESVSNMGEDRGGGLGHSGV